MDANIQWSSSDLGVTGAKAATFVSRGVACAGINSILVHVTAASVTGTSPTLNVVLQTLMPDGTTWCDIAAMTQITTNSSKILGYAVGPGQEYASTDGTLAAGTVKTVPLGMKVRIKGVIGGTNPSFTPTVQMILRK